jgi:polyhydroxyalkanoate synthase
MSGAPTTTNVTAPTNDAIDQAFKAALSKMTGGIAFGPFANAWAAWAGQLATSPTRQAELMQAAMQTTIDNLTFASRALAGQPLSPSDGATHAPDARFAGDAWQQFPFNMWARTYQNGAALLEQLPQNLHDLKDDQTSLIEFTIRQWLDALAPSNYLATNPELLELTRADGGQNLLRGAQNLIEDLSRTLQKRAAAGTEAFEPGKGVALTSGKVVFRNSLIELIQYAPTTADVHAQPILIVPAWIMKYYILDLSPKNSLVKYLVDHGYTVFMISWKNPDAADRDFSMDDYLSLGIKSALTTITNIVPDEPVHTVGYCIGGTLLAIGAAAMARDADPRIASMSLFAAQTDFSEPGELSLFINRDQLALLEAQMHEKGVLDSQQMSGAFMLLRPRDLIWQPLLNSYIKGRRDQMIDLMAWNADGTRMPYRMHTEYLYRLYLDNELAAGRFPVNGMPVQLSDIRVPTFVVGTETDHVAPWKSVYKITRLVRSTDLTFLLTSGGHNAGIISGPAHPKRKYRLSTHTALTPPPDADDWLQNTPLQTGSWWPAWEQWLATRTGKRTTPPTMGDALCDAPGQYVLTR